MAVAWCSWVFSSFILAAVSTLLSATGQVPVLIWTSNSDKPLPSASAGDHLSANQFRLEVTDKLSGNGPVIVFKQESLSLEDFTLYGNAYSLKSSKSSFINLEKILQSYPSTLLPSVELPKEGAAAFSRKGQKVVTKKDETELSVADSDSVIVFDLKDAGPGVDRQQALQKNDQFIGRVMKKAEKLFPSFVAVYTAAKSSWSRSDDGERMAQMARHILALPSADPSNYTGVFKNFSNCFLMYGKTLTFILRKPVPPENKEFITNSSIISLEELDIDNLSSSCSGNNSATIFFKYNNAGSTAWLLSLEFTMNFTLARTGEWYLTRLDSTYQTSDSGGVVNAELRTNDAWAPLGYSWNCGTAHFVGLNRTYPRVELEFNKLQIQAFDVKESFGDAYDCIGFFTVGIWMSIFSSIILLAILSCGISMVMSINTMDRFDDPKGKTITVSATD